MRISREEQDRTVRAAEARAAFFQSAHDGSDFTLTPELAEDLLAYEGSLPIIVAALRVLADDDPARMTDVAWRIMDERYARRED